MATKSIRFEVEANWIGSLFSHRRIFQFQIFVQRMERVLRSSV